MPISRERCIAALIEISAHPTAPLFEARVASYILSELRRIGVPVSRDEYGNIIALYEGPDAPETGGIALVAHLDHPAFELQDSEGTRGWLLGSVRKDCFDKRVPIRVFPALPPSDGPDEGVPGHVVGFEEIEGRTSLNLSLKGKAPEMPAFGIWDFPPIRVRGEIAHMRAIDDIVGCAAILLVLEELVRQRASCRCYGVFTRAEEIGFLGAAPLARDGILPKETIVISLETSKALPGAEIGGGPVIRVGDRMNTFDGRAETILQLAAEEMSKVQRQLMSGGACEASVFLLEGYPTTAMALPLGNYHNMTEDLTLAPEYIHLGDFAGMVELLVRAAESTPDVEWAERRERIQGRAEEKANRLRSSYQTWPDNHEP